MAAPYSTQLHKTTRSIAQLKHMAQTGDSQAAWALAWRYILLQEISCTPTGQRHAWEFSRMCHDDWNGRVMRAICTLMGYGTAPKPTSALAELTTYAPRDYRAAYFVGLAYLNGWGTARDFTKAVPHLTYACAHGEMAQARYEMAKLLLDRTMLVVEYNPAMAEALLLKAANQGHTKAAFTLGCLYTTGMKGFKPETSVSPHRRKAFRFTLVAAQRGYRDAQHTVAQMFHDGLGTRVSPTSARLWQKKADAPRSRSSRS